MLGNGWGGRYAGVMIAATDPVELACRLIACPSVTPADAGTLDVVTSALEAIGFTVHSFVAGQAPDGPVRNLYASRGTGSASCNTGSGGRSDAGMNSSGVTVHDACSSNT